MRLLFLLLFTIAHFSGFCDTLYVTSSGAGLNDGSSWANALPGGSLQTAINLSGSGDEVWVACGTYYPTLTTNRSLYFSMRNNVTVYGGFQGTEIALSQRSLSCGPCSILSGDIGISGNITDNSYKVVSNALLDSTAVLDGFYIRDGNDNRSPNSTGNGTGGGVYNHGYGLGGYCNPTIRNCIFENNRASWGAGVFNNAYEQGTSLPSFVNCIFYNNHAYIEAGGMDTYAVRGNGRPRLINCLFYENTAATNVGAMYVWGGNAGGNGHATLINTAFINNHALNGYGGAFISDNLDENGVSSSGNASVTLYNCLVWGNTATGAGQQFYIKGNNAQIIAHHSLVDTSAASQPFPHVLSAGSTNVINQVPQLLNINDGRGSDDCWLTNDDGLQLTPSSPGLDAGNNGHNTHAADILQNLRVYNGSIDIGPYEYLSIPLPVELLSFDANVINNSYVDLKWTTASEKDNDFFTVERSIDGTFWESIAQIDGSGNSTKTLTYSTTDPFPYNGVSYYRIQQTDFNGRTDYSKVRSVNITSRQLSSVVLYPNPTSHQVTITGDGAELAEIRIFTIEGREVSKLTPSNISHESIVTLDLSQLFKGIYLLRTRTNAYKLVKE